VKHSSNSVNAKALTATSTQDTLQCIKEQLLMRNVKLIGIHPNWPNIKYVVKVM